MSPTSYQTAPSRVICFLEEYFSLYIFIIIHWKSKIKYLYLGIIYQIPQMVLKVRLSESFSTKNLFFYLDTSPSHKTRHLVRFCSAESSVWRGCEKFWRNLLYKSIIFLYPLYRTPGPDCPFFIFYQVIISLGVIFDCCLHIRSINIWRHSEFCTFFIGFSSLFC